MLAQALDAIAQPLNHSKCHSDVLMVLKKRKDNRNDGRQKHVYRIYKRKQAVWVQCPECPDGPVLHGPTPWTVHFPFSDGEDLTVKWQVEMVVVKLQWRSFCTLDLYLMCRFLIMFDCACNNANVYIVICVDITI